MNPSIPILNYSVIYRKMINNRPAAGQVSRRRLKNQARLRVGAGLIGSPDRTVRAKHELKGIPGTVPDQNRILQRQKIGHKTGLREI
jgi:hypothetical protein